MTTDQPSHTGLVVADLSCERLVVRYPEQEKPVLDGLSTHMPGGRITGIIGPNGSGKTTLLRALSGQMKPISGSIHFDGRDLARATPRQIARTLGILFQENTAPAGLTAELLVQHGRFPHLGFLEAPGEADHAAIDRAFALTGTEPLRHRPLHQLSGGQRQLVWIAMVLAQETRILLLDEPTTFLDMRHQIQVMDVVRRLRDEQAITVVTVMHDVNLAARYADHMLLMREGEVIADGTPRDVITPDRMRRAYGIDGHVLDDRVTGSPFYIPDSPADEAAQ